MSVSTLSSSFCSTLMSRAMLFFMSTFGSTLATAADALPYDPRRNHRCSQVNKCRTYSGAGIRPGARWQDRAPVAYAIADKFCHGIHLLPAEAELLFKGLHVSPLLATQALDKVIAIARQSAEQLDWLFSGPNCGQSGASAAKRVGPRCRQSVRPD
jgi:hypothetical protein